MMYKSTRSDTAPVSAAQAVLQGISPEGGLYVPAKLPAITQDMLAAWQPLSYAERAEAVLGLFLTDFPAGTLKGCVGAAYSADKWTHPAVTPLRQLEEGLAVLELFHGPTCAFKDVALQLLPHLMQASAAHSGDRDGRMILVATSGDTGKAALEGFRDVPGFRIMVFYPQQGVSVMQKLQMTTQEGGNTAVCAIEGNFDDAQTGVKAIFADRSLQNALEAAHLRFSSANSINWGRLVPQIVYYVSAACDMLASGRLRPGAVFHVAVPTGNFGNILAAYYAKRMGVPIGQLICASNRNHILTDFITTGVYDRNRTFYTTQSPSMDILVSSNLERLLYTLSGEDCGEINRLMGALAADGVYTVSDGMLEALQRDFSAGWCGDGEGAAVIRDIWERHGYLCDTHTAVAMRVASEWRKNKNDGAPMVVVSTADPYKFPASVLEALRGEEQADEMAAATELRRITGRPIPAPLSGLADKPVRHRDCCEATRMRDMVLRMLV